jgi:hypothetical protein
LHFAATGSRYALTRVLMRQSCVPCCDAIIGLALNPRQTRTARERVL